MIASFDGAIVSIDFTADGGARSVNACSNSFINLSSGPTARLSDGPRGKESHRVKLWETDHTEHTNVVGGIVRGCAIGDRSGGGVVHRRFVPSGGQSRMW